MSSGLIELIGNDLFCSIVGGGVEARLPSGPAIAKLQAWSKRYDKASQSHNEGELSAIGREMFAWLNEAGWASAWADGSGDRTLEVRVRGTGGADEVAVVDAPWELLSRPDGPLALDDIQLFIVSRRIGAPAAPVEPRHANMQMMFMAAVPGGQDELGFEAEEAAILEATKYVPIRVVVEETGVLEFLAARLSTEGPFEALHLSCHGDIDEQKGPILLLEGAAGGENPAGPSDIVRALGPDPVPLVVLSACRTAELGGAPRPQNSLGRRESDGSLEDHRRDKDTGQEARRSTREGGPELTTPFVRRLAAVVPNIIGWDGSVYDTDATDFAKDLYKELAGYSPVARAVAVARLALLRKKGENPQRGRHWHLARVYVGPRGGGPLCANTKQRRSWASDRQEKIFLDRARRVPVATRAEFVGRRRAIQSVLRAFRDGQNGVLIHGMGALGKSSLAARVQTRMPQHTPVVVFERYDALAILDEILEVLDPRIRREERTQWREVVRVTQSALSEALESWLTGPLNTKPMLLIIDDLERALDSPSQSDTATGVLHIYREALAAVLLAFDRAQTQSRLLLTSRYDFRLPDGQGGDLTAGLIRVALRPMRQRERIKQWRAAERIAGQESVELDEAAMVLLAGALDAAAGNPGLQAILMRPILAGEFDAAAEALRQIEIYRDTGAPPAEIEALIEAGTAKDSDNALTAFFARVSFATYRSALTPGQARQLAAATYFASEVPIPRPALAAAGAALGVKEPEAAITRLLGLGLLDQWGTISDIPHAAANPLARPLAAPLRGEEAVRLARATLPHIVESWRDPQHGFPADPRGFEAARLALDARAEPTILEDAALAGAAWLERANTRTREALELVTSTLTAVPHGYALGPKFLRLGLECATLLGETALVGRLLAAPIALPKSSDPKAMLSHAGFDLRRAEYLVMIGRIGEAETIIRDALSRFKAAEDDRMTAIASGQIADILEARGEFDEALRIRREEELPVYERLGDVRECAVTMGQIADILQRRGELDEALRIRREEELPVYERLGEIRERAASMNRIAEILRIRGEFDEAMRIRREEVLPVYERLGDVRARAITMGQIADILQRQGELDEALRIRREEELPVYERLGDVRGRTVTIGQIADILHVRGDSDEALRIRREEQLPVYERLRDVRERTVVMGKIADILQDRGEHDEALRIRREEQLPALERLGELRERSVALFKVAQLLLGSGTLEKASMQEVFDALTESHSIAVKLRIPDGIAFTGILFAQVLAIGGLNEQALEVLEQAKTAFLKLGDANGIAVVQDLRKQIIGRSE